MLERDFANTTSAIGARAMQQARLRQNEPNLGIMLGEGLKTYNDIKNYNAYVEQLKKEHPEDAAKITMNPVAYENMLQEQKKAERDQQYKMDYLAQQFNNSLALADRQHANSVGLARMRADLENQAKARARAERAAQLDEALNSGLITQEQYNQAKQRDLLGDIVSGNVIAPDGTSLTGNKKYDDAYMQEVGKKAAQTDMAEKDAESMKPALIQAMARANLAAKNGNGIGLLGGFTANLGLNPTPNAGKNYADIQSANTQMNTYLRKQLAATGLTGSELNSAVEAEAYRYQIKPTDSESVIQRKLQNFAQDKLGGTSFNLNTGKVVNYQTSVDYKNKYGLE